MAKNYTANAKALLKNLHNFQELLVANQFQKAIKLFTLAKQYNTEFDVNRFMFFQFSADEMQRLFGQFAENRKKLGKQKYKRLVEDVKSFLKEINLGNEWVVPTVGGVLCNCFLPPLYNLHITKASPVESGKRRVMLVLNPDTSLEDIALAMPEIKSLQNQLWPDYIKRNYRPKASESLKARAKLELIALGEKYPKQAEEFYELSKTYGNKEIQELLLGLKGLLNYNDNTLTNVNRANLIWDDTIEDEDERKKAQNLKKMTSRSKKRR